MGNEQAHAASIVDGYANAQRHYREMNEREEDRQTAVRLRELFSDPAPNPLLYRRNGE